MDNTSKKTQTKNHISTIILTLITVFLIVPLFVIMLIVTLDDNIDKISSVTGTVEKVVKDSDTYTFKLTNGNDYEVFGVISKHLLEDKLIALEWKDVTLFIYSNSNIYNIIGIQSDTLVLTKEEGFNIYHNNNLLGVYMISGFLALMIVLTIIDFVKKPNQAQPLDETYFILNIDELNSENKIKYNKKGKILGVFMIASTIVFAILSIYFQGTPLVYIGIAGVALTLIVGVAFAMVATSNLKKENLEQSKKNLDFKLDFSKKPYERLYEKLTGVTFIMNKDGLHFDKSVMLEDCQEYFNTSVDNLLAEDPNADVQAHLNSLHEEVIQGLDLKRFEGLNLTFEELNLYTKVIYLPNGSTNVFISSDFTNQENPPLEKDLIFKLDNNLFNLIREDNIPVRGLDYFLSNKDRLLSETKPQTPLVVDYKD